MFGKTKSFLAYATSEINEKIDEILANGGQIIGVTRNYTNHWSAVTVFYRELADEDCEDDIPPAETDFDRFQAFLNGLPYNALDVDRQDWPEGMFCISIANAALNTNNDITDFNFYDDGKFRCLLDNNSFTTRQNFFNRTISKMGFWELIKRWWKERHSTYNNGMY